MTTQSDSIEQGLKLFAALLQKNPAVAAERTESAVGFFADVPAAPDPAQALLGAQRHLEWFLFERHSPSLFGTPGERLLTDWLAQAPEELGAHGEVLLDSFAGIFEVGEVRPGAGCWLRDMAGFGSYALADTQAPARVQPGDLLVGRLFPVGDGLHRASRAAGIFRSSGLRAALEGDLQKIRERSPGNVLRLSQDGLEKMFWGAGHSPAAEDPVGDAHRFLTEAAGLAEVETARLFARLERSPFDPKRLTHGAEDVLGQILDELAFETHVDIEQARERLLLAWAALCTVETDAEVDEDPPTPGAAEDDPAEAVAQFEAGLAAGADLNHLFGNLESTLGLSDAAHEEDDEDTPVPDFPGVVGAMVEEFLWEVRSTDGDDAAKTFGCLAHLSTFGEQIGVFEELRSADLLRFVTFWVHERAVLESADQARELVDALSAFCSWAQQAHEHPLETEFSDTLVRLRESLPRVVDLNCVLPEANGVPEDPGQLFEVRGDESGRFKDLLDRQGRSHTARLESGLEQRLRPGDRLRGTISLEGELTVLRCYPPESAGLVPGT